MKKKSIRKNSLPNIAALADLAKIALTQSEMKRFQPQILEVLEYFERIADLDSDTTSDNEVSKLLQETRDDTQFQFASSTIMKLAKSKKDGFVKGPRIA